MKAHLDINAVRQKIETSKSDWLFPQMVNCLPSLSGAKIGYCDRSRDRCISGIGTPISWYNREGVAAIETLGKGGRRNCYCSLKQEKEFLTKFHKRVAAGERLTTAQIKQAYEQQVGRSVHKSTVYRLLVRHGWRQQK